MPLKVVCPKAKHHNRFTVTAHVAEEWLVDQNADFQKCLGTLDTTHPPDSQSLYTCYLCGTQAKVELIHE